MVKSQVIKKAGIMPTFFDLILSTARNKQLLFETDLDESITPLR